MKILLENLKNYSDILNVPNASNRISQEPWYLELVSNQNCVWRTNENFLILPVKSGLILDRVYIPPFVQRLDPISSSNSAAPIFLPDEITDIFPCGILSTSNKIKNFSNKFTEHLKTNYFLQLHKPYQELFKKYNNGHKLNLKHASNKKIQVIETKEIKLFVEHYLKYCHDSIPPIYRNQHMISNLITECLKRNSGFIFKAENENKDILAYAFFSQYRNRIVYLLASSSPEGKAQYAMYAIIDEIIRNYSNSDTLLDFEGSMIPGIAYFMKGFGANQENYYVYGWNEHWLCKLKKRLKRF